MSWTTNRNKAAVHALHGLVCQLITAYVSHPTWPLPVATLEVASGTAPLYQLCWQLAVSQNIHTGWAS